MLPTAPPPTIRTWRAHAPGAAERLTQKPYPGLGESMISLFYLCIAVLFWLGLRAGTGGRLTGESDSAVTLLTPQDPPRELHLADGLLTAYRAPSADAA